MDDENTPWQYKPDNGKADNSPTSNDLPGPDSSKPRPAKAVSWEAAEFIEHPHPASWYIALILITAVLAALVYLIARDYVATGTIVVVGVIVAIFAKQKPSQAKFSQKMIKRLSLNKLLNVSWLSFESCLISTRS